MMEVVCGMLVVLHVFAVALTDGECNYVHKNENYPVEDVRYVLNRVVPLLSYQASLNSTQHQFAAILFLEEENPRNFQFNPATPSENPLVSPSPHRGHCMPVTNVVNYLVARPIGGRDCHQSHAEDILLDNINDLWNGYKEEHGREPHTIVLFTRLFPCSNVANVTSYDAHYCLQRIKNILQQSPYNRAKPLLVYDSGAPQRHIPFRTFPVLEFAIGMWSTSCN